MRVQLQMVKISDVSFYDINGTSTTLDAINITCSKNANSCVDIALGKINIQPVSYKQPPVVATCKHANIRFTGSVFPRVDCRPRPSVIEMPLDYDYNEISQQAISAT